MSIEAVFEHGVFRPIHPVNLPENSHVKLEVRLSEPPTAVDEAALTRVYDVLAKRFRSGERDTAERHDEHQP